MMIFMISKLEEATKRQYLEIKQNGKMAQNQSVVYKDKVQSRMRCVSKSQKGNFPFMLFETKEYFKEKVINCVKGG